MQEENRKRILAAALEVFARDGFRGATVDAIAEGAGMSKPNLLYYFGSKDEIYRTLLAGLLEVWLEPLEQIDPDGAPLEEIGTYMRRKLRMAAEYPRESRLFAGEMIRGAPILGEILGGRLRTLVDAKVAVLEQWVQEGRLAPHDPRHLIFAIWATTQHYADFDVQVQAVLGADSADRFAAAEGFLTGLFLRGLAPGPRG
ncbi:MAG: TetR family transcriptional regulator C-terminal domain-containing protein [Pseudomonadota bacterium]